METNIKKASEDFYQLYRKAREEIVVDDHYNLSEAIKLTFERYHNQFKPQPDKGDRAVEFAEWILTGEFIKYNDGGKCWWGKPNSTRENMFLSTKQLYEIFTNETNK